jgi:hypothetical protein
MARLRAVMDACGFAPTAGDQSSTNMLMPLVKGDVQQAAERRRRRPAGWGKVL